MFARLLPYLNPQPNDPVSVVTVNYDRLIEIGAEISGWGVDYNVCRIEVWGLRPSPQSNDHSFRTSPGDPRVGIG